MRNLTLNLKRVEKLVVLKDKYEFADKLTSVYNIISDNEITKAELAVLLDELYGKKSRINKKTREKAIESAKEKGIFEIKESFRSLYDRIEKGEFNYTIKFKLKDDQ